MTSVLFTCLPDAVKLSWGGRDRRVLVALHHAPQVFRASLMRGKPFRILVWRNVTTHTSPKYNNSFIERWYIGNGWVYELLFAFREKTFDIRGKNSGVYNFSSEKRKLTGHYSRMVQSTGGGIFL